MIVSDNHIASDIINTRGASNIGKSGEDISEQKAASSSGSPATDSTGKYPPASVSPENRLLAKLLSENYSGGGDTYSSTIFKALENAGLARTPHNMSVVSLLLDNGMSIGKESIRNMLTGISTHPDVSPQTLVNMVRAGIELTPDNIRVAKDFSEHSSIVSQDIEQIADMIENLLSSPGTLEEMNIAIRTAVYETVKGISDEADGKSAGLIAGEADVALPGAPDGDPAGGALSAPESGMSGAPESSSKGIGQNAAYSTAIAGNTAADVSPVNPLEIRPAQNIPKAAETSGTQDPSAASLTQMPAQEQDVRTSLSNISVAPPQDAENAQSAAGSVEGPVNPMTNAPALSGAVSRIPVTDKAMASQMPDASPARIVTAAGRPEMSNDPGASPQNSFSAHSSSTASAGSEAYSSLQDIPAGDVPPTDKESLDRLWEDLSSANMESAQEAEGVFENAMESSPDRSGLHRLLSDEFRAMSPGDLKKALKSALSLSSDKLNKNSVKELYKRTYEFLDKLKNLPKEGSADQNLSEKSSHAQKDLETLYKLNQMYPHFELPIKLNDSEGDGGLYVYSRNRGSKQGKGATALLHLNMPNLGQVDVHLELTDRSLKARFYSEESAGIMLKENLGELTGKLSTRDYLLNASFNPLSGLNEDHADEEEPAITLSTPSATQTETKYNFDTKA